MFSTSNALLKSAMALEEEHRKKIGHAGPILFCYCHAIELYLKALLRLVHSVAALSTKERTWPTVRQSQGNHAWEPAQSAPEGSPHLGHARTSASKPWPQRAQIGMVVILFRGRAGERAATRGAAGSARPARTAAPVPRWRAA